MAKSSSVDVKECARKGCSIRFSRKAEKLSHSQWAARKYCSSECSQEQGRANARKARRGKK
jgi:hypothetical protein